MFILETKMQIIKNILSRFNSEKNLIPVQNVPELEILSSGPSLFCGTGAKEIFERYREQNGPNYIWFDDVKGAPKGRESKLKELARQFGATRAWQISYSIPDTVASYNLWNEENKMLSTLKYDGKIITFTLKDLDETMGEYDIRKEKAIPLTEKLKKHCEDGFGGDEFTRSGINQSKNIEKLLRNSVNIASEIGADVINIYKIGSGYCSTIFTLKFYKK